MTDCSRKQRPFNFTLLCKMNCGTINDHNFKWVVCWAFIFDIDSEGNEITHRAHIQHSIIFNNVLCHCSFMHAFNTCFVCCGKRVITTNYCFMISSPTVCTMLLLLDWVKGRLGCQCSNLSFKLCMLLLTPTPHHQEQLRDGCIEMLQLFGNIVLCIVLTFS